MTEKTEIAEHVVINEPPMMGSPVPTEVLSPMVAMAMDPNLDLERVREVLGIQKMLKEESAKEEFAADFAKFQEEMPTIDKDAHVHYEGAKGITDYRHATLGNITTTVRPVLAKHGFSYSWVIDDNDDKGNITVTVELLHKGGHSRTNVMSAPPDATGGKNIIQSRASTISYLQRYTFLGVIGAAAEDDDGRGEVGVFEERVSEDQIASMEELIGKTTSSAKGILHALKKRIKIDDLTDLPADKFEATMAWINKFPKKEEK